MSSDKVCPDCGGQGVDTDTLSVPTAVCVRCGGSGRVPMTLQDQSRAAGRSINPNADPDCCRCAGSGWYMVGFGGDFEDCDCTVCRCLTELELDAYGAGGPMSGHTMPVCPVHGRKG